MTTVLHKNKQLSPLSLVKKSYFVGFFGSIVVVALGVITAELVNRFFPMGTMAIQLLQAFSLVPGSAALFEVPGWDLQTWNGGAPAEHLNRKLFITFSLVGLFLPVVAFSLLSEEDAVLSSQAEEKIVQRVKMDILRELASKTP